jgi:outer membrane protein, multidrug efflux system
LEVLDGQRSLFAAELTLAEARGNEYQSLVQLYRSLGGGWQQASTNQKLTASGQPGSK